MMMLTELEEKDSPEGYRRTIERLRSALESSDAVVIGGGAGLSASAGFDYGGKRFEDNFSDFRAKYGIRDMYSGGFYPFPTQEEYWAWWSRFICINRYDTAPGKPYTDLLELVKGRDYFVLTTNVDHQFQLAGFDKKRLFYTQGDYGLFQCSVPCTQETYDDEAAVRRMAAEQKDMRIPSELIPCCPRCGRRMVPNLRVDGRFVQDRGWYEASGRYREFLDRADGKRVLFMELGVGGNTPGIIKIPFLKMTADNSNAVYSCVNLGEAYTGKGIEERSIVLNADIGAVLRDVLASERRKRRKYHLPRLPWERREGLVRDGGRRRHPPAGVPEQGQVGRRL